MAEDRSRYTSYRACAPAASQESGELHIRTVTEDAWRVDSACWFLYTTDSKGTLAFATSMYVRSAASRRQGHLTRREGRLHARLGASAVTHCRREFAGAQTYKGFGEL